MRSGTQINVQDKFGGKKKDDSNPITEKVEVEVQDEALVEKDKGEGSTSEPAEVASDDDIGPEVMDVVTQHKWQKRLLTIAQHSKRKRTMKLTMTLWRIYVLQIPNGMGNKRAGE
ncbi:hypothetical protein V6N13_125423 [Hibiscus sabdariffa]